MNEKLNTSVALAALAAILAMPAVAADPEAAMPAAADWTAFHVGAGGGATYGFAEDSTNVNSFDVINFVFASGESFSDLGNAGGFGTVEASFDYQMESLVAGVLASYDFGKTKMKSNSDGVISNINNVLDNATLESKWEIGDSWAVGGRLGFLVTDSALLYILGGYTQAKIKSQASLSGDNSNFEVSFSDSKWEDGWFAGGGIEALLSQSISLKGEYRYADFGKVDRDDGFNAGPNFGANATQSADITVHSVRAALSYRFGL